MSGGAALFDRIVIVDWSASASPTTGRDSIWIAALDGGSREGRPALSNPATRHVALGEIAGLCEPGRRTLVGVDFSLGFPSGTAVACGLTGSAWQAMWRHLGGAVVDDERNRNNRFAVAAALNAAMGAAGGAAGDGVASAGPFWGCPPAQASATLTVKKPTRPAASEGSSGWPGEWRIVERALRTAGHRPFSVWQLLGAGAVGGQSLVGIAALERLRSNLGARVAVWPFTTGLGLDPWPSPTVDVVIAEVWPSLWPVEVPPGTVKDAAQVDATARRLGDLDRDGELRCLFDVDLDGDVAAAVVGEEGWLLGVDGRSGHASAET